MQMLRYRIITAWFSQAPYITCIRKSFCVQKMCVRVHNPYSARLYPPREAEQRSWCGSGDAARCPHTGSVCLLPLDSGEGKIPTHTHKQTRTQAHVRHMHWNRQRQSRKKTSKRQKEQKAIGRGDDKLIEEWLKEDTGGREKKRWVK